MRKSRFLLSVTLCAMLLPTLLSAAGALEDLSAKDITARVEEAYSKIKDYSCTADAHYTKGYEREDKVFQIYFKRPWMVRIEVLAGDTGAVAVLNKDMKVKGHKGGWLSWLVLSPDIDSPLVKTIRGHRLDQSHFLYMAGKIKETVESSDVVSSVGEFGEQKFYVLELDQLSPNGEPVKKLVYIDPGTWLIKRVLEYEDGVEVVNVVYSPLKINSGYKDSLFDL